MKLRLLAALVAGGLVVAACGSDNSSSGSGATTTAGSAATTAGGSSATTAGGSASSAASNGAPLKIAVLAALTGPIAQKGLSDNATLAANQINAAGGIDGHKVEVSFFDTMDLTPQSGRVAMQKALASNPDVLIGSNISGQVAAGTDLVNQAGIPMINIGADPSTDPGQQNGSNQYFRLAIRADRQAEAMSRYVHDTLGAKKVVIGHSTDLTSTDGFNLMKKNVEAMGIQVTETNWAPTATDLTNSALATKGADALMLVGYPAPEAQMVKTMRANGINIPIIADYGFSGVIQGNLVPADNLSNVAFVGNCEPLGDSPNNAAAQKFLSDMKANFPTSYIQGFLYDGVNVAAQAAKSAGSVDPKALKTALAGLKNYAGACGTLTTDAQQNFLHQMPVISAEGGKETFKTLVDNL